MKTFYSAQDIEALAAMGQREIIVDENTVLTDLARDAAAQLGVRLVSAARLASEGRPASRPAAPAPAAQTVGKPRGCQHGPLGSQAGGGGGSSAVVDELVSAVKQLSGGKARN